MLRPDQKAEIRKGFDAGFSDVQIANSATGINKMQVHNFRHGLGITTRSVTERRWDVWLALLERGVLIDVVADAYNVGVQTVRVQLWKNRPHFSSLTAKPSRCQSEAELYLRYGIGKIPDLSRLGLEMDPLAPPTATAADAVPALTVHEHRNINPSLGVP